MLPSSDVPSFVTRHWILPGGIMLRVLLESKARRQRRIGGMALSVAAHLAIIGAVTATTVHARRPARDPIVDVHLAPPPPRPVPTPHVARPTTSHPATQGSTIVIDQIHINTEIPTSLPPVDYTPRPMPDYVTGPAGTPTGTNTGPRSIIDGDEASDDTDWRGNDLLMRIVTSAAPRYPESLRQAGIDGRVLVRFIVDTLGKIDLGSVQIVESTHDLFTRSVRDVLGNFRFRPAEAKGHRVRAMAEMPFEFQMRK
jgi:protein TonB